MLFAACGGESTPPPGDGTTGDDSPPNMCEPLGAIGQFTRRAGNPRIIAGATFTDNKRDIGFADPDIRFDATANRFDLYYSAEHSAAFGTAGSQVIRRATSPDRMVWTVGDVPALAVNPSLSAWDSATTEAPSVVFDPDAPADRRYLMLYSGSKATFPNYTFADSSIGAAISADGITFTRISAADSPHGEAGLVFKTSDVYPGIGIAQFGVLDDPEVVLQDGIYHLFFSSFACDGTNCANVTKTGVGHATSTDGIHWTNAQTPVRSLLRASADERTGGRAPSVIYDAAHCRWELWQTNDAAGETSPQPVSLDNTAGVWHAESSDALQWSIFYTSPRDVSWSSTQPDAGETLGIRAGFDITQQSNGRVMMYVGYDDDNVPAGSTLPTASGTTSGVMTLNVATRDVP
jgi:hypothetical protein